MAMPFTFAAIAECGCLRAACTDDADAIKSADAMLQWVREGLTLRYLPTSTVREMRWCCEKPWCPYQNRGTDAT